MDNEIAGLEKEIAQGYTIAQSNLDDSFQRLQTQKQSYQSTIEYTTSEELQAANQKDQYKLEYLWTKIGQYATKNNLTLKADLTYGSSGFDGEYNIQFTAMGEYLPISEFVYAIEKDTSLGFKIDEFQLVPYSENVLQSTFLIKNVTIDPSSLSSSVSSKPPVGEESKDNANNDTNNDNEDNETGS